MTNPPVIDERAFRKACDKVLAGRTDQSWLEDIILQFILAYAPAGEQPEPIVEMHIIDMTGKEYIFPVDKNGQTIPARDGREVDYGTIRHLVKNCISPLVLKLEKIREESCEDEVFVSQETCRI